MILSPLPPGLFYSNLITYLYCHAELVELFDSSKANISEHIKHIFTEEELNQDSVVRNFRITANDGKDYRTKHYNLDLIISLGYRVNSSIQLKEYQ